MERTACLVPFCRRTTKVRFPEWVCSVHWPMVSKRLRRRYTMAKRLARRSNQRFLRQYAAQGHAYSEADYRRVMAAFDLRNRIWDRCKAEAIQRAAGIS